MAASQQGLVHRDLKPANLMLVAGADEAAETPPGSRHYAEAGEARVKVIDFGLAKAAADAGPLTGAGDFLGTPQFASPEQFGDGESGVDARSDIYSLGVTLWYALTGKLPFPGRSLSEVHGRQLSQPLPTAQLAAAHVPAPLAAVLASMLAAHPADRPQTPHALLDALRHCRELSHAPVPTVPSATAGAPSSSPGQTRAIPGALAFTVGPRLLAALGAGWWVLRSRPAAPGPPAAAAPLPAGSVPPPEKSIAVLPFDNLSADQENAFFADGVQDEILTDLSRIADLKVVSRSSVVQYKAGAARNLREIAAQLGVARVLEGSVQRAGNKVRVNAQLVDARTDAHLWAQVFDRPLDDVFAIQSEVAQAIADKLQAKLSPREQAALREAPTRDLTVFELYQCAERLTGSSDVTAERLAEAVRLTEQAEARDPGSARAYASLAELHASIYRLGYDHSATRAEAVRTAAETAARLRPDSGEAHLAAGIYQLKIRHDNELTLAVRGLPNDAVALLLLGIVEYQRGRLEEALGRFQKVAELDPQSIEGIGYVTGTLVNLRRYPEALRAADQWLAAHPEDLFMAGQRAASCWKNGRTSDRCAPTWRACRRARIRTG